MTVKDSSVLMISLERGLFEKNNRSRERILKYRDLVKELVIIVYAKQKYEERLGNVRILATCSMSKLCYVLDAVRLAWKMRDSKFDLVVTQDVVDTGLAGFLISKFLKIKLALQDHSYIFHGSTFRNESFINHIRYWLGSWLIKKCSAIRVVSDRTEKALLKRGIVKQKIINFPLTVESGIFNQIGSVVDVLHGQKYFLIPARFVKIKRLDLALAAFAKVHIKRPQTVLVLIGRGPLTAQITKWSEKNGLDEACLKVYPWTQDLAAWYRGATGTLITSDQEGFGMTAIESLLCGTPLIMTDVGCAGQVVHDGLEGYIVPIGNADALAQKMERLLEDPDHIRERLKSFVWDDPRVGMREFWNLALS